MRFNVSTFRTSWSEFGSFQGYSSYGYECPDALASTHSLTKLEFKNEPIFYVTVFYKPGNEGMIYYNNQDPRYPLREVVCVRSWKEYVCFVCLFLRALILFRARKKLRFG